MLPGADGFQAVLLPIEPDVPHDHVGGGPALSGLTVEMEPGIRRQGFLPLEEGVHFFRFRPDMVRASEPGIAQAEQSRRLLFRQSRLDLFFAPVMGLFLFVQMVISRFPAGFLFQPLGFFLPDGRIFPAHIGPVVVPVPADSRTVEITVVLLAQVH